MIAKRKEESLLLRMILVGDRLKKRRDTISQRLGISTQQWLLLLHTAKDPNIPFFDNAKHEKNLMPNEIATTFGTSRANITSIINSLVEKNYIALEADEIDKRRKRLSLTIEGENVITGLQKKREQLNSEMFKDFTDDELTTMLGFLERFITNIEK